LGFQNVQLAMQGATAVTGRAYTTLLVLAHIANDETSQCWPSIKMIAFLGRQSTRTARRNVLELEAQGVISVRYKAARRGCNLYTLNVDLLTAGLIRISKPILRRAHPIVQKPVEKLCIPCGSPVEKAPPAPIHVANSGTRTSKEVLGRTGKHQVIQRATVTGRVYPEPHDRPPGHRDLVGFLKTLRGAEQASERARASPRYASTLMPAVALRSIEECLT